MGKKKTTRTTAPTSKSAVASADGVPSSKAMRGGEPAGDFMEVGQEVVPGMRLRCICRGHTGTIGRIAWSPCGRFIASPSTDETIRIWDANDGRCLAVLKEHVEDAFCVTWSPDGKLIASGDSDGTILIWRVPEVPPERGTWSGFKHLRSLTDHGGGIGGIEWSPNGRFLASGSWHFEVFVWQRDSYELVKQFRAFEMDGTGGATNDVAWCLEGRTLLSSHAGGRIFVWNTERDAPVEILTNLAEIVRSVACARDGERTASVADNSIAVWERFPKGPKLLLEAHTDTVIELDYSSDSKLLASKSKDATIRIWPTDTWRPMSPIAESVGNDERGGLAFHRKLPKLATSGDGGTCLRIWDLDVERLLADFRSDTYVRYTSAKIVLVGQSNVGKSCLAMRLAEDRYPEDHEHGTTHGMRFWPMEAEKLHAAAKPPEGQRRDVVLWDFGGQDEYQLVHQMFLHDTTLALVLIDPTRGRAALDEARDWNKRLEKHLGGNFVTGKVGRGPQALASGDGGENTQVAEPAASAVGSQSRAVKILVGAKVDKKRELIDQNSVDALCKECGFAAFVDLSAKTGRNTRRLRKLISDALDWEQMAKTSRPELFQHIRDDVEARRKKKQIVLTLEAFKKAIKKSAGEMYEEAAVDAVSDQLATQGIIVRTHLTGGDEAIVLQLPVIERYAGSLIIAARNNPRGVPVLEERLLGSTKGIPLPGMEEDERLDREEERMVLECVVELMIQNGICFRHGGLLVFPTLFPASGTTAEKLPHSVSLYYDFTGAIDNIYASLVSKLMVSEEFGEGRLRAGRVEFDAPNLGICGIRQIKRPGGLAHVDLFFAEDTDQDQRDLFTRFVERHLNDNGVDIREHQAIKCRACEYEISEDIVQENIARDEKDVVCPKCRTHTLISEGVARIRDRNPESDQRIAALRTKIDEEIKKDVARAKAIVSSGAAVRDTGDPIRVLHLSDLHFTDETNPQNHRVPLLQDIRRGEFLGFDSVEYLVISGDMTDRGDDAGFDKAREFVEQLIDELGLSAQRCIFVPGNHDVQDLEEAYRWFGSDVKARKYNADHSQWHREGQAIFVPDQSLYPNRLKRFSDAFYHKVVAGEPYPLDVGQQGMTYLFADTGIQFFAFNSAWQIDQFHRERATIHPASVTGAVDRAGKQIARAIDTAELKKNQPTLRLAVWHHALEGKWAMQDDAFLEQLQLADVKICLHGDVHELRMKWLNYWDRGGVHIVGAGSFGSPEEGRPESVPRLYNLLEIQPDFRSIRVHTRSRATDGGAWEGYHKWPNPSGGRLPYFDIRLEADSAKTKETR